MTDELTVAARSDIAHHLHSYTNLPEHEQTGPLVLSHGKGIYVYRNGVRLNLPQFNGHF